MLSNSNFPTRRVEIFENERYSPLSGWSAKALLLTDRKAFSNNDGSDGYGSLEDANNALLSKGWHWDADPWIVDKLVTDVDAEGWSYRTDFTGFSTAATDTTVITQTVAQRRGSVDGTIEDIGRTSIVDSTSSTSTTSGGSAQKGIMHIARRRKFVRLQYFDASSIIADVSKRELLTCDHCDLEEVLRLAKFFEEKLAEASVKKYPRHMNERKINAMKTELVDFMVSLKPKDIMGAGNQLLIQEAVEAEAVSTDVPLSKDGSDASTQSVSALSTATASSMSCYDLDKVNELFTKQFLGQQGSLLSFASSVLVKGSSEVHKEERLQQLRGSSQYTIPEEMEEFARLFIRIYDESFHYHCSTRQCGETCLYRIEQCSHSPCKVCYSYVHHNKHDAICPEKIIPCTRTCGVELRRKELQHHMNEICILRPIECPFYCIGCHVDLIAKDLDCHLHDHTTNHMLLSLSRMQEYEKVMAKLHTRVNELESIVSKQQTEIVTLSATLATTTAALAIAEKKLEQSIVDTNKKTEKKCIAHADAIGNELRGETGKLNRTLADLGKIVKK